MVGLESLSIAVAVHELSVFVVILNGAFIATSGNRFNLFLSVFISIFKDYSDAFSLLLTKQTTQ